ncbi:MAG: peptide chain release factor N(5)-glutamine methyltransferase [Candidatus Margulisiibacteriota bacterium]|nr:MAG: protein-(glutamine-N5) methyltransferase, release factor-specific [Candidatus Margulisbacteria bacterium GWD2_39_127]OGI02785.1 MAG: protein-(glutamine-N5) methyltransferase, release factor-specific [Candidatus Margulisbacteria bacterium GWF2_38_17]OGI09328.1 MAG: protein-(glutamine-N5) methyltransferase, release factor-specific [Candidatus Margulisbacteria bacterium GWE2_39_32]PZM77458.1 MAG: peptide chain release factor N(5)-glutamine methyltransferase [Candidatus Margulisiibacteriota 
MTESSWTIIKILKWSYEYLEKHNIDNPKYEAEVLLSETLHLPRLQLFLKFEKPLNDEELANYRKIISQRVRHIPYQYIFKKAYFLDYELYVDENVLIPRPETELLVEVAIDAIKEGRPLNKELTILDIGSGSGCISIALSDSFPEYNVVAVEKSIKAMEITQKNANRYNVKNLKCINKGIIDLDFNSLFNNKLYVISNPPYILTSDLETLSEEVKKEPVSALDGGIDGLMFYRQILNKCKNYRHESSVIFEIGYDINESINQLLIDSGVKNIKFYKDYQDIDRIVTGTVR